VVLAAAGGVAATATEAPSGAMIAGFRAAFAWATLVSLAALAVWLGGVRERPSIRP
jgi:hypothetical protein